MAEICENKHKNYTKYNTFWKKCRDTVEGQEAVHTAGISYLPKLGGQTTVEYNAYVLRALFFNATGRTLDALSGMLFRKSPQVTLPTPAKEWEKNIDLAGLPLLSFTEKVAEEVISVGRCGVLVDMPTERSDIITAEEASKANMRPFASLYKAENILDWQSSVINGARILSYILLDEIVEQAQENGSYKEIEQRRILDIDDTGYRVRLFRKDDSGWALVETIYPKSNNSNLSSIPFVFFNPQDVTQELTKPPLLDMVNVNLSHYRTSADLEHGSHYTALPTPVITGHEITEGSNGLSIGSGEAWVISSPEAKAFYLEFKGDGLGTLQSLLASKENMMAVLGARILSADKKAAEAAETESIRRSGENSVLASMAGAISSGMTIVLEIMTEWAKISGDVSIQLNRDYLPAGMTSQQLTATVGAWQGGAISEKELFENLKNGELIVDSKTFEEHQENIFRYLR